MAHFETTATFAEKPTLVGDRVVLRPFVDDDLAAMAAAIRDPEVGRLTGSASSTAEAADVPEEDELREWYSTRNDQPDRVDLAIVDRATRECVGEAVLDHEWVAHRGRPAT
jgi:RimJ/RimL family protein N-acetyltransferase